MSGRVNEWSSIVHRFLECPLVEHSFGLFSCGVFATSNLFGPKEILHFYPQALSIKPYFCSFRKNTKRIKDRITFLRTLSVTFIHFAYIPIGKGLIHKHSWVLKAQFGKWLKDPQSAAGGSQLRCVLVIRRGCPCPFCP